MTKKKKKETWKEKRHRAALKHQKAQEAERLKREREPKKSRRWPKGKIFGASLIFLLIIIGIYGGWQYIQSPKVNEPIHGPKASLFTLTDINGNTVALENLIGKVVILNFFFPTNQSCDAQMIHLQQIYGEYTRDEVEIISISVKESTIEDLQEFKTGPNNFSERVYEMSWTITRDTGAENVTGKYNIESIYPVTVIIDQEGYISRYSPFVALTKASTLSQEIDYVLGIAET